LYDIPVEYHHMPSHRVIDDINEDAAWTGLRGFWEEEHAAHSVRIWPEPTGDIEVKVRYAAGHAINVLGTAYTTIPAEDLSIIADLVMAEILRAKAVEFSVEPDYVLGQQRETKGHLVENAMRMAADLRNSVHHKYGVNAVVAAP